MKFALILFCFVWSAVAASHDFTVRCADRAAIERVYHKHRLGEKPTFEQALPQATLEKLVQQDLRKEAALKKAYGVEVTPAMLEAEVQRINTTTRAPAMLAEIKAALGNDPARFAEAMARPIVVERVLRERFDNDDAIHAPQRREMERVRSELTNAAAASQITRDMHRPLTAVTTNELVGKLMALLKRTYSNEVSEMTWQLGTRPEATPGTPAADEIEIKKRFGAKAQVLSSPGAVAKEQKFYFDELPSELRNVLRAQLRRRGDVSAVIETPHGFLFYLVTGKNSEILAVALLSRPKRSYDEWLSEQARASLPTR